VLYVVHRAFASHSFRLLWIQPTPRPNVSDEPVFRAGAATSNITPPIGSDPTVRSSKPQATHVHDELHARCLVLDDGQAKLALVVCDLRHISAEVVVNAKQIIQRTTGIPPECVLVSATHTHTSTGAKLEEREGEPYYDYRALLTRRIAEGVLRAVNQLEPARIGWGVAEEPTQVFNRRWFLMPSRGPIYGAHDNIEQVDTNPGYSGLLRPAGPVDPQITFLSVQSTAGKPIALLASYGLHYVGGVPANTISADYFAIFADRVGELLGADRHQDPPFVGIMANGTSGDVNNLARYSEEELAKRGPQPKKRYQPYEKAREVAHLCAEKVMEAHKTLEVARSCEALLGAAHAHVRAALPDEGGGGMGRGGQGQEDQAHEHQPVQHLQHRARLRLAGDAADHRRGRADAPHRRPGRGRDAVRGVCGDRPGTQTAQPDPAADEHFHRQRLARLPADARAAPARRLRNLDRRQQGATRRLGEDGRRLGRDARRAECKDVARERRYLEVR
jgi:hypothetical protein